MSVNSDELKKAMETLGISDIHMEKEQVRKIYKKLLLKWHPDSCPNCKEKLYTEVSAKINAAYDTIEQAYLEGLMGPSVKTAVPPKSSTYEYTYNSSKQYSKSTSNSANESYSKNTSSSSNTTKASDTYSSGNSKKTYSSNDYSDSADGLDIIYYRKRWLNVIFLTICTLYIIKAVSESPRTDIYIEQSVISLISALAFYYSTYWFIKCFAACFGLMVPGIIALIIYRVISTGLLAIYDKFGPNREWMAMLLFIIAFFTVEYFIHIKKILLTFDNSTGFGKITKFFSYFMLAEYFIILIFGIYSVILVHKSIAIRNVIIPPWY